MRHFLTALHTCRHDGCGETRVGNHFEDIRSAKEGWFFQRNGEAWCPNHNPEWVIEWRSKKKRN
jgi:hypothetical protein